MAARLDRSTTSIVVWCQRCPGYSALRFSEGGAYDEAVSHEQAAHPELNTAMNARSQWRNNPANKAS